MPGEDRAVERGLGRNPPIYPLVVSLFPSTRVFCTIALSLYTESTLYIFILDGVFLPCDHELDFFTSAQHVRIQSKIVGLGFESRCHGKKCSLAEQYSMHHLPRTLLMMMEALETLHASVQTFGNSNSNHPVVRG